jgi:phytoene/squalene synthetase
MDLFDNIAFKTSKLVTRKYSTSFSIAVSLLPQNTRQAIYSIYGFVRFADEIVDTFHEINQKLVLDNFERDYNEALSNGISMNPVLHAFAITVKQYKIPSQLINSFLKSMRTDLEKQIYFNSAELKEYIYGSADVVGLMCLMVFVNGDDEAYKKLKEPAMKLGSAFQKVNFLRDMMNDKNVLGRIYFPEFANNQFDNKSKKLIEQSIENDFNEAWIGLKQLPGRSKLAVALAYFYYRTLFDKIKQTVPEKLLSERVRINNLRKYLIMIKVGLMYKTKLI